MFEDSSSSWQILHCASFLGNDPPFTSILSNESSVSIPTFLPNTFRPQKAPSLFYHNQPQLFLQETNSYTQNVNSRISFPSTTHKFNANPPCIKVIQQVSEKLMDTPYKLILHTIFQIKHGNQCSRNNKV